MAHGLEYWLLRKDVDYCVIATVVGSTPSSYLVAGWSCIETFYWRLDAILEKAKLLDNPVNFGPCPHDDQPINYGTQL